jgi:hypothetical protein
MEKQSMPVDYPYVEDLSDRLIGYFKNHDVPPHKAYLTCLLTAGRLSAPPAFVIDEETGLKYLQDLSDYLGAYFVVGEPS